MVAVGAREVAEEVTRGKGGEGHQHAVADAEQRERGDPPPVVRRVLARQRLEPFYEAALGLRRLHFSWLPAAQFESSGPPCKRTNSHWASHSDVAK